MCPPVPKTLGSQFLRICRCVRSERFEPSEQAGIASPGRRLLGRVRLQQLQCFALGIQVGLSVVMGGLQARMAKPAADHGDIDSGGGVPKRVWRYPLGCQPRRRSGSGADVLRELEAHARCAQGCTVAVYECRSSLACGWRSSSAESNSTVSGHSGQMRSLRPLPNRGPQSGRRSTAAATPSLQACVPSDARRRTPFGTTAPHYSLIGDSRLPRSPPNTPDVLA